MRDRVEGDDAGALLAPDISDSPARGETASSSAAVRTQNSGLAHVSRPQRFETVKFAEVACGACSLEAFCSVKPADLIQGNCVRHHPQRGTRVTND